MSVNCGHRNVCTIVIWDCLPEILSFWKLYNGLLTVHCAGDERLQRHRSDCPVCMLQRSVHLCVEINQLLIVKCYKEFKIPEAKIFICLALWISLWAAVSVSDTVVYLCVVCK